MNYGESRKPQGIREECCMVVVSSCREVSAYAITSALVVSYRRGFAEDSDKTAIVRCEEGGDDVKSARPLRPGLHTCYNGGYRGPLPREWMLSPNLSVRTGVCNPTHEAGFASNRASARRGEYVRALYTPPVKP